MTQRRAGGLVIVGVLSEAVKHFGRIDELNKARVTAWVQRRIRELEDTANGVVDRYEPRSFDAKAAASGERE